MAKTKKVSGDPEPNVISNPLLEVNKVKIDGLNSSVNAINEAVKKDKTQDSSRVVYSNVKHLEDSLNFLKEINLDDKIYTDAIAAGRKFINPA